MLGITINNILKNFEHKIIQIDKILDIHICFKIGWWI